MSGLREFLVGILTGHHTPDPTPDPEPTAVCVFCKREKPITEMTPTIWRGSGLDAPTCDDCCANHCRFNYEHGDWELLPDHKLPSEVQVLALGQV